MYILLGLNPPTPKRNVYDNSNDDVGRMLDYNVSYTASLYDPTNTSMATDATLCPYSSAVHEEAASHKSAPLASGSPAAKEECAWPVQETETGWTPTSYIDAWQTKQPDPEPTDDKSMWLTPV